MMDSDTSAVDQMAYLPKVSIENFVSVSRDGGKLCGSAKVVHDVVEGIHSTPVTYFFTLPIGAMCRWPT
jgi:uncharacterized protein (UPF0248 family)